MRCNKKKIEEYLNDEMMSQDEYESIKKHIANCHVCNSEYEDGVKLKKIFGYYRYHEIDNELLFSLNQIQYHTKKKFSICHLLPQELAITAASVIVALYAGILFSSHVLSAGNTDIYGSQDYFEQISLVSLLDR